MDVLRRHPVLVFGAVPLADVVRIREGSSRAGHERGRSLSPLGPPNLWLHLAAPAEIEGLLGITRRTGCLGLRVDDPAALAAALRARGAAAASPVGVALVRAPSGARSDA